MKKLKYFFSGNKGAYRMLYSLCILLLSVITVAITANYEEKSDNTQPVQEESFSEEPTFSEEEVKAALSSITEQSTARENEVVKIEDEQETEEIIPSSEELSFELPVYGKVIRPYSTNEPLYSKTMDDWRIHEGVDIACPFGTEVYASESGTVSECGYDINLGYFVKIESGSFECVYTSLSGKIPVNKGDTVHKGQIIGTVSDSCISEICDEPHLHFEMKEKGVKVNPADYLLFP
ncbi:MAG: M23 family metallopeptidase [Ruminococcaceae bacterium]|nr:M23 family metallopeptidase [Oscillospiraceae bacterium]